MTPKMRQVLAETRSGLKARAKADKVTRGSVIVLAVALIAATGVVLSQTALHHYDRIGLQILIEEIR